jgi:hypothetical protein
MFQDAFEFLWLVIGVELVIFLGWGVWLFIKGSK